MIVLVTGTDIELQAAIAGEVQRLSDEEARLLDLASANPLLFLDFDGVLNHQAHFAALAAKGWDPDDALDPACVDRLNFLLNASGAYVTVSSSWRIGRSLEELRTILSAAGFAHAERVVGKTPVCRSGGQGLGGRGAEILTWLRALPRPHECFVILDDGNDMDGVREHLVRTDMAAGGLTDRAVERALRLFGRWRR